jgi:hypothetical protein
MPCFGALKILTIKIIPYNFITRTEKLPLCFEKSDFKVCLLLRAGIRNQKHEQEF